MKFSSKVEKCGQSPMRKFHPYAVAAEAKGKKILPPFLKPSASSSSPCSNTLPPPVSPS